MIATTLVLAAAGYSLLYLLLGGELGGAILIASINPHHKSPPEV
jgi:hypothetical protein